MREVRRTCDWGWPGASLDALDAVHQQRRPRLVHREARVPPMVSPAIAASAAAAMVAGAESAAARVAAASHGADRIGGAGDRRPAAGTMNETEGGSAQTVVGWAASILVVVGRQDLIWEHTYNSCLLGHTTV